MEKPDAVAALAALAQDNRLDVFRLLVKSGPAGLPAGRVAEELYLAPNMLTFHFDRLRAAGLVTVRREGRSMIMPRVTQRWTASSPSLPRIAARVCPKVATGPNASRRAAREKRSTPPDAPRGRTRNRSLRRTNDETLTCPCRRR
jgi:ArsR family transcriptional regulator, arsenate/arsenite/antimonite-responsive transcriptional repressor